MFDPEKRGGRFDVLYVCMDVWMSNLPSAFLDGELGFRLGKEEEEEEEGVAFAFFFESWGTARVFPFFRLQPWASSFM